MKKLACAVLLFLACAPLLAAQTTTNSTSDSNGTPTSKLRDDLRKAIQNGNLSDQQKTTMQNAGAALRAAAEARQNGEKVDRSSVKKAFSDIEKVTNSNAFRPEDQQAVKADLEAIKEKASQARGGRRHGLFRQFGALAFQPMSSGVLS